jgi:FOG: PKD repeat
MIKKVLFGLTFVCLAIFGCNDGENGSLSGTPTIIGMTPSQAGNGDQNLQGIITGTHLSGAMSVTLGSGITVHNFHSNSDTQLAVTFSVAGDTIAGARRVTVVTTGGTISSDTVFRVVIDNQMPVAAFTVSPAKGNTMTSFSFDASHSRDPDGRVAQFHWEFGDGKHATGKRVQHHFDNPGNYSVVLSAKDNGGLEVSQQKLLTVTKFTAQVCTQKLPYKPVGIYGTVLEVNGDKYKFRTDQNETCATAYYKCGDFDPPGERSYYGTVCSMKYFGDRLFEIGVVNAKARPVPGSRAFIKAQKCRYNPCN